MTIKSVTRFTSQLCLAMLLTGYAVSVVAAANLSREKVQALATAAARSASYDLNTFVIFGVAQLDPVTKVWRVDFVDNARVAYMNRFRVFVFDATSHTEVTCVGMMTVGAVVENTSLPVEVQPFITTDERPTDLECADLKGDGRPGYVLVTQNSSQTKRTLQILLRESDGRLKSAVQNVNVVQPPFEDGINGSHSVIARRNKISVINTSAGSGGGDDHVFYFEYSDKAAT